jgi:Tol biopolymer transport system component
MRLMRRRDRKRRNQRLAAGVVGIAIGAAIILAGISISRSDQSPATPSPTAVRHNGDVAVRTSRGISVIDPSTGRSRVVLNDPATEAADWSPDGTELAYIVKSPTESLTSLRIWNERTGRSERIYSCRVSCGDPFFAAVDWSPDGSRLAFQLGSSGLYVIGVDGSNPEKISNADRATDPSWSSAGDLIVFSSDEGVFVIGADGSGLTFVANGDDPAWSPDGSTIAFFRSADGPDGSWHGPRGQIWVMRPDGSHQEMLLERNCCLNTWGGPAWSPDGRKLAFVFGVGFARLFVMNADGSDVHVWGGHPVGGRYQVGGRPSWQPVP